MSFALFEFDWSAEFLYIACAVAGGTLLVLQTALIAFGVGDGDADHDFGDGGVDHGVGEGHDGGFHLFSVRAIASFFTFFGLAGWYGTEKGWSSPVTLATASATGLAVMGAVAWALFAQRKLQTSGNVDPRNALGLSARVYLRIPAANAGFGKITAKVQGRTTEFNAYTLGAELPTGSLVKIARMSTPDTFEVEALKEEPR